MGADRGLVEALEAALKADPGSVSVRRHLIQALFEGDEFDRAWTEFAPLIAADPTDVAVLALGVEVARASGRQVEAEGYERLMAALGAAPTTSPREAAPTTPARKARGAGREGAGVDGPESDLDPADVFLRDVLREDRERHVTLADVAGLVDVKAHIERAFLSPLRNPELRVAYGKSLRGGLLLWGPPGCGKTFLARAIAGELGAEFISVGIQGLLHGLVTGWVRRPVLLAGS